MRTTKALAALATTTLITACTPTGNATETTLTPRPSTAPVEVEVEPAEDEQLNEAIVEESAEDEEPAPAAGTALETLWTLPVVAHDIAPYDREDFGGRWVDFDGTGCSTRQDVLRRDATQWIGEGCQPQSLVIQDRYTQSAYVALDAADIDIDHVVSVHDAWLTGAQSWDLHTRVAFYQDKLNLIATAGSVNRAKSNLNAAQWEPPHPAGACDYAARVVSVKARWGLGVTDAEQVALAAMLESCPGQGLLDGTEPTPVFDDFPYLTEGHDKPVNPPADVAPVAPEAGSGDGEVYYENCAAARAAGAAPLHRGEPGYRPGMDGDGDGVACE